jgi:diguanylate cyclase (GGDEF)-like protein
MTPNVFRRTGEPMILQWAEKQPAWLLVVFAMVLDFILGLVDYFTGFEVSFAVFYLMPVALVSRYVGMASGVFMSVLAAATWLVADTAAGSSYSDPVVRYFNGLVLLGFFITVCISLVSIKSLIEELREMSLTDPLTGVANTRSFRERANIELDRSLRNKHPLSLAYLDLDDFKAVNDEFGHSVGDELLVTVAGLLKSTIRRTDVVARLGGDEFAFLFPETDSNSALTAVNRIRDTLIERSKKKGLPIAASIGVVTFAVPPASLDEMMSRADSVMYQAKRLGKNSIQSVTYSSVENTRVADDSN